MKPEERPKAVFADIFASSTKRAAWVEESWARITAAITAAEEAEREACAKVADEFPTLEPATGSANTHGVDFDNLRGYIAAAIRARGKQ